MNVLETVFLQLLRMAAMTLPVMAVVLALRLALRRAPRKYSYALWAVVGFRLACPVTLSLPVSIFNLRSLESAAEQAASIGGGTFSAVTPAAPLPMVVVTPAFNTASLPSAIAEAGGGAAAAAQTAGPSALTIVSVVWLAGVALLLGWFIAGFLRLRRQVAQAVRQDADVWECDGIPTPFVLGLFRPRIYIPFHLGEEERRYVLSHERCHIRRRDHLVKPLALLILAVYWWNPAVWLCWVLFCRDMEMRCDEAVLEELGDEVKTGYSTSLLSFALDRRIPMALAFGEHDASRRVKHVLDWKRARPAVVFLALTAVVLTTVVCGTNATTRSGEAPAEEPSVAEPSTVGAEEPGTAETHIEPEELLDLLPKQYMFASGAGGWRTMLYLNADGSFTGDYIDTDMGSMEAWGCRFQGRFALPEKVAPYSWRLGIEELTVTGLKDGTTVGDTYIDEDGTRYTVTEPYGLDNADELLVYLPGIATASLPEGFFSWARGWGWCLPDYYENGFPAVFPFYGLYNAAAEQGWVAVTEDESYAVYVDFRTDGVTNTSSQLHAMKSGSLKTLVEDLACYDVWAMTPLSQDVEIAADGGELTVTVTEPPPSLGWDDLTALAGNNAAMLLALRGELTKVDWQVYRDGKTLKVTLRREDENWLLSGMEGSKSTFLAYGESRDGIQELIGLLEHGGIRYDAVMTEPFHDVLGYDGYIESKRTVGWDVWEGHTYCAETAEGTFPIAECFGPGGGEAYRVDLDGDGQEELVCNVTYGADDAPCAYVYQRRADGIYVGELSTEGLPDYYFNNFNNWGGVNDSWSEYDPVENIFRLHYRVGLSGDGKEYAVLETHGLERMEFIHYMPYNK